MLFVYDNLNLIDNNKNKDKFNQWSIWILVALTFSGVVEIGQRVHF